MLDAHLSPGSHTWFMRVDKSILSSIDITGSHFVLQNRTIHAILVDGILGNIHVKLF